MYQHDLNTRSGARPHPKVKPAGPQICSVAADLGRSESQHLGSQTLIFPQCSLLWDCLETTCTVEATGEMNGNSPCQRYPS